MVIIEVIIVLCIGILKYVPTSIEFFTDDDARSFVIFVYFMHNQNH